MGIAMAMATAMSLAPALATAMDTATALPRDRRELNFNCSRGTRKVHLQPMIFRSSFPQ